MYLPNLFDSFVLGGFECSSHRRHDGRRLDLLAATGHDRLAAQDYRALLPHGLRTVRDGLRWHLIERPDGEYDWSSFLPMLQAANDSGVQVIWDLCHYGWPDHVDIWRPRFVERFARFAREAARVVRESSDRVPFWCPVNEISYWAWAGGDQAQFAPMARGRGGELKRQLTRAAIAAMDAMREVDARARFVQADPTINVVPRSPRARGAAEAARQGQFEAWDMLCGLREPGLGGEWRYLDIIGVNFYSNNQWYHGGDTIWHGEPHYRPFHEMLTEVWNRYERPIVIAETGAEGEARVPWVSYVCDEVMEALRRNIPVEGICLYPVLDYPGWKNERYCETGLLSDPDEQGQRKLYQPLADLLARQRIRFEGRLAQPAGQLGTG